MSVELLAVVSGAAGAVVGFVGTTWLLRWRRRRRWVADRPAAIVAQADRRRGRSVLEGDGELRSFEDAARAGDVPLYPIELPFDPMVVAAFRKDYEGLENMLDGEVAAIARCVFTRPEVVVERQGWLITPFGAVRPRSPERRP